MQKRIKIGILTFHRAYNNGAYLQACALCNRLNEEKEINAEIIDFQTQKERNHYDIKNYRVINKIKKIIKGEYFFLIKRMDAFEHAIYNPVMKKSKDCLETDSLEEFAEFVKGKYDIIVTGSDEVWKVNGIRGFPNPYWLIGDLGCKKFSYAASARVNFEQVLSSDDLVILKDAISDFDFISVRDDRTKTEVEALRATHQIIHKCCDPSFVYDFDITQIHAIERIRNKRRFNSDKKTVTVIVRENKLADKIRKDLEKKYNIVALYYHHNGYINVADVTPIEWLSIIRDSDFVISSLFHAACFSIVQKTPFVAIEERKTADSKLDELLNDKLLRERYIKDWTNIENFSTLINNLSICYGFETFVGEKRKSFQAFLDAILGQVV